MDIYAIEQFCERWINKSDNYGAITLEDLFDQFFTLFVAYNRLYSAAAELHRITLNEQQAKFLQGDRKEATTVMARLITQPKFSILVKENQDLASACQSISILLKNHNFFLHSIRGTKEPDLKRDIKLAEGLQAENLLAVLECLYQIRCNIFHGEKEFAPRQAELLNPAITLLKAIVGLSMEALHHLRN